MLSVSTATVHETIRPKTPESSPSPPNQGIKNGNRWNCEYTVFTKRRCRPSPARKKIITSIEDATIGIDVHCQTVRLDKTPIVDSPFSDKKCEENRAESSPSTIDEASRSLRCVPFVKSSQMQKRAKAEREGDEDDDDEIVSIVEGNNAIARKSDEKNAINGEESFRVLDKEISEKREGAKIVNDDSTYSSFAQTRDSDFCDNDEDYLNPGIPGIRGEDLPRNDQKNDLPLIMEESGWDSDAEISTLRDLREFVDNDEDNDKIDNAGFNVDNDNEPHYVIGLPNPPGENRCWLNATLHALFSVPLIDHIDRYEREQWHDCSLLTKTFLALKLFWSQGKKQNFYQTVRLFKESLGILDESYPSQRQQDVSEFLTMFLNYLKTDFERFVDDNNAMMKRDSENTENITRNHQETRETARAPNTPSNKSRQPLTDISPCKRKFNEMSGDNGVDCSPKIRKNNHTYSVRDLSSPRLGRISNTTDPTYKVHTPPHNRDKIIKDNVEFVNFSKNPIDRYYLLHMMEHYVCKGCAKHRQRKVDNLMIYIDLLHGSDDEIVYLDKSIKNTREPEERTLTCGKCKYGKHKVFTTFRHCPKILMVQINRYGMCNDGSVAKFNTPVEIPETLQLELGMDIENGNATTESFEPVCVIAHVGSAMDCGHYTSYVKHEKHWYHYNDLVVTPMSRHEALTAARTTAYVVFFASTKL